MKITQEIIDEAMQKITEMFGSIEVYAEYKLFYYDKKYYSLKNFKDPHLRWSFISNVRMCTKGKLILVDIELIDKLYLIYSQKNLLLLQKQLLANIDDIKNKIEIKKSTKRISQNIKELKKIKKKLLLTDI